MFKHLETFKDNFNNSLKPKTELESYNVNYTKENIDSLNSSNDFNVDDSLSLTNILNFHRVKATHFINILNYNYINVLDVEYINSYIFGDVYDFADFIKMLSVFNIFIKRSLNGFSILNLEGHIVLYNIKRFLKTDYDKLDDINLTVFIFK